MLSKLRANTASSLAVSATRECTPLSRTCLATLGVFPLPPLLKLPPLLTLPAAPIEDWTEDCALGEPVLTVGLQPSNLQPLSLRTGENLYNWTRRYLLAARENPRNSNKNKDKNLLECNVWSMLFPVRSPNQLRRLSCVGSMFGSDAPKSTRRITPTANYLPFINGGRFEALLLTTIDPIVEAKKQKEAAAAAEEEAKNATPTPHASLGKSRWSFAATRMGVASTKPEITLKGVSPLKDQIGESWVVPQVARSFHDEPKAVTARGPATPKDGKQPQPQSARHGSPSARRGPRKYERELRQRDITQRDGHILAADTFDRQHQCALAKTERANRVLSHKTLAVGAPENGHVFRKHLLEIASTRFVAPERPQLPPYRQTTVNQRTSSGKTTGEEKPPFDLYRSIWRDRLSWATSGDLYDTDEVIQGRFQNDWQRMLTRFGAAKVVLRTPDAPSGPIRPQRVRDEEQLYAGAYSDEVIKVGECFFRHYQVCCCVFGYYCAFEGLSLETLPLRAFLAFCSDCNLISKRPSSHCREADLIHMFLTFATGAPDAQQQQQEEQSLGRAGFFTALVRVAIHRYVIDGDVRNVAEALSRLLRLDILACVGEDKLQMPNDFRRRHAYTEAVCEELSRRKGWLKRCFEYGASLEPVTSARVISLVQWVELIEQLDLLGPDVSEREAVLCFSWSRTCYAEPQVSLRNAQGVRWNTTAVLKETCLPFEGFLEALCRIAALKVLPNDDEIDYRGDRDAAEFLNSVGQQRLGELLAERSVAWGARLSPEQPMARCLYHVVSIMASAARHRGLNNLALPDAP